MSSGGRTRVEYHDDPYYPNPGERYRERYVEEVSPEEIEAIRGKELEPFRQPVARARSTRGDERDYYDRRAYDNYFDTRPRPLNRLAPPERYRYGDRYDHRSAERQIDRPRYDDRVVSRRRDGYSSGSDSDSDSSRERRNRRRHRRTKSEQPPIRDRDANNDDDDAPMWHSCKPRKEGKWHERNFDSSMDGLLSAAAGAAFGAVTAKAFGGPEKQKYKMAGGALAGATAFNLAENKYRVYTEERQQSKQKKGAKGGGGEGEEGMLAGPLEFGGHWISGI